MHLLAQYERDIYIPGTLAVICIGETPFRVICCLCVRTLTSAPKKLEPCLDKERTHPLWGKKEKGSKRMTLKPMLSTQIPRKIARA